MPYGEEVRQQARQLRKQGVHVKVLANRLGVSTGWASGATYDLATRKEELPSLLEANEQAFAEDAAAYGALREKGFLRVGKSRKAKLEARLEELRSVLVMGESWVIPNWESVGYRLLDRTQQVFARDPAHPLFAVAATRAPRLLSHLVEWKRSRHRKTQNKSDAHFGMMAFRVRDHVLMYREPPSVADPNADVQDAALWLSRWKSNAVGRTERKRNIERADLICRISIIVEQLRSPAPGVRRQGLTAIDDGRWKALFDALVSTRSDPTR